MKKDRFLWSAHRITERQKAGKARSIKGKQLKNSRSTASKPLVAHLSSASADLPFYRTFAVLLRQNCFFIACFPAGLGSATAHVRRLPRKGRAGRAFESSSKHRAHGKAVPAMHLSSPSANLQLKNAKKARKYAISGLFLYPKFCLDCSVLMEFERKFMGL